MQIADRLATTARAVDARGMPNPKHTPSLPEPTPIVIIPTPPQLAWHALAAREGMEVAEWLAALGDREVAREGAR